MQVRINPSEETAKALNVSQLDNMVAFLSLPINLIFKY